MPAALLLSVVLVHPVANLDRQAVASAQTTKRAMSRGTSSTPCWPVLWPSEATTSWPRNRSRATGATAASYTSTLEGNRATRTSRAVALYYCLAITNGWPVKPDPLTVPVIPRPVPSIWPVIVKSVNGATLMRMEICPVALIVAIAPVGPTWPLP